MLHVGPRAESGRGLVCCFMCVFKGLHLLPGPHSFHSDWLHLRDHGIDERGRLTVPLKVWLLSVSGNVDKTVNIYFYFQLSGMFAG